MPYVQLCTSVRLNETKKHELCDEIGKLMPLIPGKTRDNTMMSIIDGCYMEKINADNPALNFEVRVLGGVPDAHKKDFIEQITALFDRMLGVKPDFMSINIAVFDDWGSGGRFIKAPPK